jgi:hypothetical protein
MSSQKHSSNLEAAGPQAIKEWIKGIRLRAIKKRVHLNLCSRQAKEAKQQMIDTRKGTHRSNPHFA